MASSVAVLHIDGFLFAASRYSRLAIQFSCSDFGRLAVEIYGCAILQLVSGGATSDRRKKRSRYPTSMPHLFLRISLTADCRKIFRNQMQNTLGTRDLRARPHQIVECLSNDLAFSGEQPPERSEEGRSAAAMPGSAALGCSWHPSLRIPRPKHVRGSCRRR